MTIYRRRMAGVLLLAAALLAGTMLFCDVFGIGAFFSLAQEDQPSRQLEIVDATNGGLEEPFFYFFEENKEGPYTFGPKAPTTSAEDAHNEFRTRLKRDPALLAAVANYVDHELQLGDNRILRKENGELVGAVSNAATKNMLEDPSYRKEVLNRTLEILDSAKDKGLNAINVYGSWMYMQDANSDGIPEIIIRDPDALRERSGGTELTYTFEIDGKEYKLHIRLECGYQPIGIIWWEPPTDIPRVTTAPPPPPHTTPKTTTTVVTTPDVTTTTGVFKRIEDVVTVVTGDSPPQQQDLRPSSTINEESRYIPSAAGSTTGKKTTTTTVTESQQATQGSTQGSTSGTSKAESGTRPPVASEDKIISTTKIIVEPEPVTVPASDYTAPQEPALSDIPPVSGTVEIPN